MTGNLSSNSCNVATSRVLYHPTLIKAAATVWLCAMLVQWRSKVHALTAANYAMSLVVWMGWNSKNLLIIISSIALPTAVSH